MEEHPWVCTGTHYQGDGKSAEAYRLVPERFFDGEPTTYNEVAMLPFEQRIKPEGFYHGMTVKRGKHAFVLVGPSAVFLPLDDDQIAKQADLFDLL